MPLNTDIDTIYHIVEEIATSIPDFPRRGIQFYLDFEAEENAGRNYKWELSETWEYRAAYPRALYYDGAHHQISPPDSSFYFCWKTERIENIFTLTTKNLTENKYFKYPLHYVDNKSSRLENMYSLYIKQYALSDSAYIYWDQLSLNENAGGLYEQQPIAIKGNLYNRSDPEIEVLGYFAASSIREKRIFVNNVDLFFDYDDCSLEEFDFRVGWKGYPAEEYPIFYLLDGPVPWILSGICENCIYEGGTTEKPDYWPN